MARPEKTGSLRPIPNPGWQEIAGHRLSSDPGQDISLSHPFYEVTMETELLGITLGAVLPLYPLLFAIHQKIGRYDEIVEEFKKLRSEHDRRMEVQHGS
jgi:hypothetical protein